MTNLGKNVRNSTSREKRPNRVNPRQPAGKRQKAIIVVGMHRSGASALSGLLSILGVDFGSQLVTEHLDNPKSVQRSQDIIGVHDRLLSALNLTWNDLDPFPDNWWTDKSVRPFQEELSSIIGRDFGESELWALNDPRMCRLMPLWLQVFREVKAEPYFVHMIRNPIEVAESLRKRNGFSRRKSILLWMLHELDAEQWTRDHPRVFVSYKQLLQNWPGTVERISDGLGISFPVKIASIVEEVSDFLDLELKHHNRADDLWAYDPDAPHCVLKAYSDFESASDGQGTGFLAGLSECRAEFEGLMLSYPSRALMDELRKERSKSDAQRDGSFQRLAEAEKQLQERDDRLSQIAGLLEASRREIEYRDVRITEFEQTLSSKDSLVQGLTASVQELEDRISGLSEEVCRREADIEAQASRLDLLETELAARDQETVERESLIAKMEAQLRKHASDLNSRQCRITDLEKLLRQKDDHMNLQSSDMQNLREHFQIKDKRIDQLASDLEVNNQTLAEKEKRLAEFENSIRDSQYRVLNLQAVIQSRDEHIRNMYNSTSWRMSAPVRWIADRMRAVGRNHPFLAHPVRRLKKAFGFAPIPFIPNGTNDAARTDGMEAANKSSTTGLTEAPSGEDKPSDQSPTACSTGPPRPAAHEWPIDRWKRLTREQIAFQLGRFSENIPELLASIKAIPGKGAPNGNDEAPLVSIIIPCFNSVAYTLNCIRSVLDHETRYAYEIIAVDDCSTDETSQALPQIDAILYLKNDQNMGFIHTCNAGAKASRGQYVLFLNSDTLVLPGWLDELVDTFSNFSNVGLVGSKLLYPDGKLQEAGCIIWNDGSAWNYGRGDDPFKPEYNYARQVDYCSGASIIIPRDLFDDLGGFDLQYAPAYCEDSDIALKISSQGKRVLYQPLSTLIHFEGISCGVDTSVGVKACQVANMTRCFNRHADFLVSHGDPGVHPELHRDRNCSLRALIVDAKILTPDKDSGSLQAWNFIKILQSLGYQISFVPVDNFAFDERYSTNLQRNGLQCLYWPYSTHLEMHLEEFGEFYDLAILSRVHAGGRHIDDVRTYCKNAKIVFDTIDLHFLREMREASLAKSEYAQEQANRTKERELEIVSKSDCTMVVSQFEYELLNKEVPGANIALVPFVRPALGRTTGFQERSDIAFIGGYQHPPNVDSVLHFVQDIWPLVRRTIPSIRFWVVGSRPTVNILDLAADDIIVTGYIENLGDVLDRVKLTVAPLRYGAGIKGKIAASLGYGVPCVATSLAVEGMVGINEGENISIADDDVDFARRTVDLYFDEKLWQRLSDRGLAFVTTNYSFETGKNNVMKMLESIGAGFRAGSEST